MSDHASSPADANRQLQQLADDRGLGKHQNEFTVNNLGKALAILSDQLYSSSTHFLAELIQNADDNAFEDPLPTLILTLTKDGDHGRLRLDCNEVGFTLPQINALCSINASTKKKIVDGQKAYTGEKGIGFKSVFKVVDVVDIRSGFYEFRINRINRKELIGMLVPKPSSFPERSPDLDKCTQMLLHLRDHQEYKNTSRGLRNLKPEVLLFLRKLRRLEIRTATGHTVYSSDHQEEDGPLKGETRSLVVTHHSDDGETKPKETNYAIVRYLVKDLPTDERRLGVSKTELLLGFPTKSLEKSREPRSQLAFAFLPIGKFGFKVTIIPSLKQFLKFSRVIDHF